MNAGEIHAIMGRTARASRRSAIHFGGRPGYEVTGGSVEFDGQDLLSLEPHERAAAGLFLGFQYPVEIPGVSSFISCARRANPAPPRTRRGRSGGGGSSERREEKCGHVLDMCRDMLKRAGERGFSGGEKKRVEILQMGILEPKFADP